MTESSETASKTTSTSAIDRRSLLKATGVTAAAVGILSMTDSVVQAQSSDIWDKTFAKSDKVEHRKVSFPNRFGVVLVGDLYVPRNLNASERLSALVVAHPYGGVKEQTSGLYAQTLAERGFVTIAYDASFHGESGGEPRANTIADFWVEDISAAVDYLGKQSFVDRERIGAIGICGGGGYALAAAATDQRIKAVATSVMYDIGQGNRQGLSETFDLAAFQAQLDGIAKQRWTEVDGRRGFWSAQHRRRFPKALAQSSASSSNTTARRVATIHAPLLVSTGSAMRRWLGSGPSTSYPGFHRARCSSSPGSTRIRAFSVSRPTASPPIRKSFLSFLVLDTSICTIA